jgi:hypothetical protein
MGFRLRRSSHRHCSRRLVCLANFRPNYNVLIRIRRGECRLDKGKLTAAHLKVVAEICSQHGVQEGWIGTQRRGRRAALRFSKTIPEDCRQQLRNLWPVHA